MSGFLGIFGRGGRNAAKPPSPNSGLVRRKNARYEAAANQALLCWWDGEEYHETVAHLVNVSQGGALIHSHETPPKDQPVFLRLLTPEPTEWIELRVVREEKSSNIGTSFPNTCPYELYKAVTSMLTETEFDQNDNPEYNKYTWR